MKQLAHRIRERVSNMLRSSRPSAQGASDGEMQTSGRFLSKDFKFESEIGRGFSGIIYKASQVPSGKQVVVKSMKKDLIRKYDMNVDKEIEAHSRFCRADFVVNYFGCFEENDTVYLVQEHCPGGDLFNFACKRSKVSTTDVCFIICQVIAALKEMHDAGFIHRDIKLENALVTANGYLKLCDLGFAHCVEKHGRCYSEAGTRGYLAPEILKKKGASYKSDIFSVGVMMFELLNSAHPFRGKDDMETWFNTVKGRIISWTRCGRHNKLAESLMSGMLEPDEDKRLSIKEVMDHPYFAHVNWECVRQRGYTSPLSP